MNNELKSILNKIEENGFEAYIVGGFVRDYLLGNNSYDVDICTNALPKEISKLFNVSNETKYGNISFKIKKYNIDITTYRKEIKYYNRKPIEMEYISNLIEDLKRRDFTINTICMNKNGSIIDFYNAKEDLNNKLIRAVGNVTVKLNEDPLRILRALRFSVVLGFSIEEELELFIKNNISLLKQLSFPKIRLELNKIIHSKNYLVGIAILKEYNVLEILNIKIENIKYTNDLIGMYAQMKCDSNFFTKNELDTIINIKKILKVGKITEKTLYEFGLYNNLVAGEILEIDKQYINNVYNSMEINDIKKLDISSNEIMQLLNIEPSAIIKDIKKEMTNLILEGKLINNNKELKNYLLSRK